MRLPSYEPKRFCSHFDLKLKGKLRVLSSDLFVACAKASFPFPLETKEMGNEQTNQLENRSLVFVGRKCHASLWCSSHHASVQNLLVWPVGSFPLPHRLFSSSLAICSSSLAIGSSRSDEETAALAPSPRVEHRHRLQSSRSFCLLRFFESRIHSRKSCVTAVKWGFGIAVVIEDR